MESIAETSARIKLSDGRYLAYKEMGVPKNESKYKIIIVHGFGSSKEMNFLAPQVLYIKLHSLLCSYKLSEACLGARF